MKTTTKRSIEPAWVTLAATMAVCLCLTVDALAQAIGGGRLTVRLPAGEERAVERRNLGNAAVGGLETLLDNLCQGGLRAVPEDFAPYSGYPIKVRAGAQGPVELHLFASARNIAGSGPDGLQHTPVTVNGTPMTRRTDDVWEHREILDSPSINDPGFTVALRLDFQGMIELLADIPRSPDWQLSTCGIEETDLEGLNSRLNIEDITSLEITAMLVPLDDKCRMSATVTGDVTGRYRGDVAFFNENEDGILEGFAGGSIGDRKMQDLANTIVPGMEGCETIIQFAEQFGTEPPAECVNPDAVAPADDGTFRDFVQEEMTGDDTFGLSLVDMKEGQRGGREGLRALTGAGFTLNLSGKKEGGYGTYKVSPSMLTVTPGAISGVGGIKFELQDPSEASVNIKLPPSYANLPDGRKPSSYYGTVIANLETNGPYTTPSVTSPRPLKIRVEARFSALEGSTACLR